ncbi:MAG: endonuclease III [Bacillota bacterium]|jgi:endonuclease-3|nr:endonuclease III [Bacillota bacterium]HHU30475.1 endonuclease III [Bacillota bacterium]
MTNSRKNIAEILAILEKNYPNPATELNFETPWQLLVAAVLSAQSTDKQVNKVTKHLFAKYPAPGDMAVVSPEQLAEDIKILGLYRTKSKYLVAAARKICKDYGGKVPQTRAELESLPGVGRKTAGVILANAFGIPAFAVDTHVFRVANRLGLAQAKTPAETEKQLTETILQEKWAAMHHRLILHGRYTCTARRPECRSCELSPYCSYYDKQYRQVTS